MRWDELGSSPLSEEHRFLDRCLQVGQPWALERRIAAVRHQSNRIASRPRTHRSRLQESKETA